MTRILEEEASGGRWDRPELRRVLEQLRPGDFVARALVDGVRTGR